MTRSKLFAPAVAVLLGVAFFIAQTVGGDPSGGLFSLAVMAAFGALVLLGGRSETIRGLRGDGRDERFRELDIRATAIAGYVVLIAIIIAFLIEMARDRDGAPYSWLGAIGGIAYLVAIAILRVRR